MPLRRLGKVGKEWLGVRREWVRLHPPNHQGYYICAICGRWVPAEEMELDHITARSRRPDMRSLLDNLQALCGRCNARKGSRERS